MKLCSLALDLHVLLQLVHVGPLAGGAIKHLVAGVAGGHIVLVLGRNVLCLPLLFLSGCFSWQWGIVSVCSSVEVVWG